MRIRRYTVTFAALVIFIISLYSGGMLSASAPVSRGTSHSVDSFSVKQGVTQDGNFALMEDSAAPRIPPRLKFGNHSRTLRAFVGTGPGGNSTVFVESVKPHAYYVISSSFTVSQEFSALSWPDLATLQYYGTDKNGLLFLIRLNVHTLVATTQLIDASTVRSVPTVSESEPDL